MTDVLVIGAGPAGVMAAVRAADLGARTTLVAAGEFGGMAANDGPVPVRVLAHAARLIREARRLGQYGVTVSEPVLDYPRLLARVNEVVGEVCAHSSLRQQIDELGVAVHQQAGAARFVERAVGIAEVAAIAVAAGMRVDEVAQIPLAYPTYTGALVRAAASAARQLRPGRRLAGTPGGVRRAAALLIVP